MTDIKTILAYLRNNSHKAFFVLTIAMVVGLNILHFNYQEQMSQGDHGRDLYAFAQVLHGQMPYKDFWWVYGPLMPYYYGVFNLLFGVHISSILLAKVVLNIICGIFFYLTCTTFTRPALAFFITTWFMQAKQDFFFTYNHLGGAALSLVIIYYVFAYIEKSSPRFLWIALISAFLFILVKINFGLAAIAVTLLSVWLIDRTYGRPFTPAKKKWYIAGIAILPLAALLIYGVLLSGLSFHEIRQCMPYFGDDQPHHVTPWLAIVYYLQQHWLTFVHSPWHFLIGMVLHTATGAVIYLVFTKKLPAKQQQDLFLRLGVVGIFFLFYFQEFLVSGVWYRTFWSQPFVMLFHGLLLATVLPIAHHLLRWAAVMYLWGIMSLSFMGQCMTIHAQRIPPRFLSMPQGQIYVGNEGDWIETVATITEYLNTNLKKDELFFALPYDCIYYYLTGKPSPTRQLIFFEHIKIPTEQEMSIIRELENKRVNYVLMSNRMASSETGMGILGKTYCPLIYSYITSNFTPVARQGGNWQKEPGWGDNHGVIIFKRK